MNTLYQAALHTLRTHQDGSRALSEALELVLEVLGELREITEREAA